MIKILLSIFLVLIVTAQLFAINLTGNSGFAIPLGSWSDEHNSGKYFSFGSDILKKHYIALSTSFDVSTFSGKINSNYHFQCFSTGCGVKFYPLYFIKNSNLFTNVSLSYNFMERQLHSVTEKGNDLAFHSLIGAEFKIGNNWIISMNFGERHFFGGIDMLTIGAGLGYNR